MNIAALVAGLLSGIIGGMGLGGGAVLLIYLTVFVNNEQLNAQGINLLFFIPIAITAVTVYAIKKQIVWKRTLPLAFFGAVGSIAGIFFTSIIGSTITSKVFGSLLVLFGISQIFDLHPLILRIKCGILKKE